MARNLTDPVDGFLRTVRQLIHDCDPLYTRIAIFPSQYRRGSTYYGQSDPEFGMRRENERRISLGEVLPKAEGSNGLRVRLRGRMGT